MQQGPPPFRHLATRFLVRTRSRLLTTTGCAQVHAIRGRTTRFVVSEPPTPKPSRRTHLRRSSRRNLSETTLLQSSALIGTLPVVE